MSTDSKNPLSFLTFNKLQVPPPIKTNSILHNKTFNKETIASDARGTRIIVHPRFPTLVEAFLTHKHTHGSKFEKVLYANTTWRQEISRLIEKRPLVFMGSHDHSLLRNGTQISDPTGQWDRNGTGGQGANQDLTIEEYLSYDEIMLSSLIGVSGPSYFINDGARSNCGRMGKPRTFEERGIIMGLVGARFERADRMDSIFVLPPVETPKQHPELTKLFLDFFGVERAAQAKSKSFDDAMYRARMRITVDVLFLEANTRAKQDPEGKTAYVYVVGLGLGVWERDAGQTNWYIEACADAIGALPADHKISTVEFAWIDRNLSTEHQQLAIKAGRKQSIKVIFSKRNPAAKLETSGKELLVLSYAWDGNAFPGNEYWQGSLVGSGDPAAACMSTIGELHNPLVNPYTERIAVAGDSQP